MKQGRASRTAEYVALFRALEPSLPPARRMFEDRLATAFLSPRLALVAWLAGLPGVRDLLPRIIDHRWPGARSSAVARTRFIDDAIRAALEAGTEQFVLLGAGFDSRASRLPGLNYLTEAAVDSILRWCSRAAPGSQVVFTYVQRAVLDNPRSFVGTEKLFATLAAAGEKWTFGLNPSTLADFLRQRGLSLERDLGAAEYRRLYFIAPQKFHARRTRPALARAS